ncbi:MAG: amidohydrolase [Burkholderiales bacterium]|jgi:amidohydrolase|nr:amidohydrolase [Burkholderiales bacterium]
MSRLLRPAVVVAFVAAVGAAAPGVRAETLQAALDAAAVRLQPKLIDWRRDIHANPELGNREFRTSALVAAHLERLGMEVRRNVGKTGVVAVLKGGKPGKVLALRADMDALPVTEEVDLPFASKAKGIYEDKEVGVMHACGHDAHVAVLMAAAEALASVRAQLPGAVKFIFQPAEEGPPAGEPGGAKLMIEEGALDNPKADAIFGLHVFAGLPVGQLAYRPGPAMASSDILRIKVRGRQTHGAAPWGGVDPVVVSAQIVTALQSIIARQVDITKEPGIVSIGSIHGGVRFNIIPDTVDLVGTVRAFDDKMREDIFMRIRRIAENVAEAHGATAEVVIEPLYGVTVNDPPLMEQMLPTLKRVAGDANVILGRKLTGAEDFSYYQLKVPGIFWFIGVTTPGTDPSKVAFNHSPRFQVDEAGLPLALRTMLQTSADWLEAAAAK